MKTTETKSLFMLIGSMAIFGTIGIFRKYIPLSSALLAMLRGFIGAGFLALVMLLRRQRHDRAAIRKNLGPLLLSGAMIGLNWMLLFEAYNYTTVATATLCYYMQPVFLILASPLVLHEKLSGRKLICVAAALLGMVFVSGVLGTGFSLAELKGVLFGLGAALIYTGVVLVNKRISGVPAMDKTLVQLLAAAVVLLPYILFTAESDAADFTPLCIGLVLVVGIFHTGITYTLYFGSMEAISAQTVAIFGYVDPIVAVILGAAFLHEPMDALGWVGAVLILGAAVISELPGKNQRKGQAHE